MSARLDAGDRFAAMTYTDSQMAEADLIAFEARVAHDEALFETVDRERALRVRLRAHYDAVLDEPVPAALLDLLGMAAGAAVLPTVAAPATPPAPSSPTVPPVAPGPLERAPSIAAPAPPRPAPGRAPGVAAWPAWAGMAACLVLGVGLGLGARALAPLPATTTAAFAVGEHGELLASGPLGDALEQRSSGASNADARGLAIGISFRDKSQDWCRTFAVDTVSGIACKSAGAWRVAAFERAPVDDSPAAGTTADSGAAPALSPTLLLQVDALRDGDTPAPGAEAAARAGGWQR